MGRLAKKGTPKVGKRPFLELQNGPYGGSENGVLRHIFDMKFTEKHEISEKIDFFDFLALLATLAKRADSMTGKLAPKRRFSRFLVGKRGPYGEGKNGTFLEGSFSEIWGEKNAFFCTSSVSENFEKIPDPEAFFWTLPETAAK